MRRIGTASLFCLLLFSVFFSAVLSAPAYARDFDAEIADVVQPAFVTAKAGGARASAQKGQKLLPGDTVETGPGGEAEILYADGNLTRLDENSHLIVEKLAIVSGGSRETVLRLDVGRIKNSVSKLATKHSKFEVHTSSAVAGVTGTPPWVVGMAGDPSAPATEVDLLGNKGDAGEVFVEGADRSGRQMLSAQTRSIVESGLPPSAPLAINASRLKMLTQRMVFKTPQDLRDLKRNGLDEMTGLKPAAAVAPAPAGGAAIPAPVPVPVPPVAPGAAIGAGAAAGAAAGAIAGTIAGTAAGLAGGGSGGASAEPGVAPVVEKDAPIVAAKSEETAPAVVAAAPAAASTVDAAGSAAKIPAVPSILPQRAAGGQRHSLHVKEGGNMLAWGYNDDGQLGNGDDEDSLTPVAVKGMANVIAVSAGAGHSIALKADGTVWGWGDNDDGQLGDGSDDYRTSPVQVKGPKGKGRLEGAIAIAAGATHTLALRKDGSVWAWGNNNGGQLGNGTIDESEVPVRVEDLEGVVAIAAGEFHSVAAKADGTVWAWGMNTAGQLGDKTIERRLAPVQVKSLSGIVAVAAGRNFSAALKKDGSVWTWGSNQSGQLGTGIGFGPGTYLHTAAMIKGLEGVVMIAAGGEHMLALNRDGNLMAWGNNGDGQLCDGTETMRPSPVHMVGGDGTGYFTDAVSFAAGYEHTIIVKKDGNVWACGANSYGQVGDGTEEEQMIAVPVQVK